jgi:hypothetical protein
LRQALKGNKRNRMIAAQIRFITTDVTFGMEETAVGKD